MTIRASTFVVLAGAVALTACSNGTPQLMNLRNDEAGPDEFSIVPTRELELPATRELPTPTPNGTNLADPNPEADAIAALGGNINRAAPGSQGLVSYTTRFGVQGDIRGTLAAEDEAFRRGNNGRLLERVFNVNTYFNAYRRQALDRYSELERLRRAGVQTPSAPPAN